MEATAATILNRVKSDRFPNSVHEVIYQKGQFDPIRNGSFNNAKLDQITVSAVIRALRGEDLSNGALFFYVPETSTASACKWFDTLTTTAKLGVVVFKK